MHTTQFTTGQRETPYGMAAPFPGKPPIWVSRKNKSKCLSYLLKLSIPVHIATVVVGHLTHWTDEELIDLWEEPYTGYFLSLLRREE